MKKLTALLLALVMVVGLCACGNSSGTSSPAPDSGGASTPAPDAGNTPAPSAQSITLRIAISEAPESQMAQVLKGIKERVESRTEGRVVIEPHYSNELGSIADCIEQITLGGNIVSMTSASSWAPYGCADMTAMDSMFAFSSTDEIEAFNESDMWKSMVEELEANGGIHVLCMNYAAAPRVILANRPINSVADIKGLLVRVPTDTYAKWFEALGAAPVSGIPFAEVYTNIESGVIEAAEAPFGTLSDYSVQEVAKYAYCSNHTYAAGLVGTSTAIWNMISAEDQKVLEEEFYEGGKEYTALCAENNTNYIQQFKDAGVTVVEPSAEDIAAMQEAAAVAAVNLGLRDGVLDEIKAASQG